MARTIDDQIDEKARLQLSELLRSRGIDSGRVSIEVLFLLPPEFVREYRELYERALKDGVEGAGGAGTGNIDGGRVTDEKAGRERNKSKGKRAGHGSRTDGRGDAKGGSKARYKTYWQVKDEDALALKNKVDRELKGLIGRIARSLKDGSCADSRKNGSAPEKSPKPTQTSCDICGRRFARGWVSCPYPH